MKREIKFRAYDKRFNVMLSGIIPCQPSILLTDVEFNFSYGDKSDERNEIGVDDGGPEHYCITDDQIDIMQFAGIKDQSGGEIYEGDIVRVDYNYYNFPKDQTENPTYLLCKFSNGSFNFFYKKIERVVNVDTTVYQVIGNIYENPELIF